MKKCPNCGRPTERTKDWACIWCGHPLLSGSYRRIEKTYQELKAERLPRQEPVKEEKAEKLPRQEPTEEEKTEKSPPSSDDSLPSVEMLEHKLKQMLESRREVMSPTGIVRRVTTSDTIDKPLVSVRNLERIFTLGSEKIKAVHDVDLDVSAGELIVITGRSGAGKTTLLNLLAGLDHPTSGSIYIQGQDLAKLSELELTQLRRRTIGFVLQSFGLLPLLSTYENVELPLRIANWKRAERQKRTEECIKLVGLAGRAKHRPYELSGGEQQRVAIARALVCHPCLILADEPTGELDSTTGAAIFALLQEVVEKEKVAVIVVTHDVELAVNATVCLELSDGTFVT